MQNSFHLKIISPAQVIIDDHVPMVQIPGAEGDFGVLPGHSALFSMVRPGVINVTMPDGSHRKFFAANGYADVTPESCTVISDQIQDLTEISMSDAESALGEAKLALTKAQSDAERTQAEKLMQIGEALAAAAKGNY